jgi:hypothetical protein
MVVRRQMSKHEQTRTPSLTSVRVAKRMPIEAREDLESVREKIMAGQAFLRVVEYPWGVEFDVYETGGLP